MATVLNRATKKLRRSVNTPDFDPADYIINPDLSAVEGQPSKYWEIRGDVVSLMNPAQRKQADADELAARDAADRASEKARMTDERLLRAMSVFVGQEMNKLNAGTYTDLTPKQVSDRIQAIVDTI